jgi:hypothetical protein
MSEVAVKIYETKRNVQRFHLKESLHGKNGASQTGIWVNSDTNEPVNEYVYPLMGNYRMESTIVGKHVGQVEGPFCEVDGEYCTKCLQDITKTDDVLQFDSYWFVSQAQLRVPINGLTGLAANTEILHYYLVLRFLDE